MKKTDKFCVMPWQHLFVSTEGFFYPCCNSQENSTPFKNAQGLPIIANSLPSISEAWNSEDIRQLRRQMLEGEEPQACAKCFRVEKDGGLSLRQAKNQRYKDYIDELILKTEPNGNAPLRLQSADFRLGNVCNLKCRMCSGASSSLMRAEEKSLGLINADPHASLANYSWFNSDELWEVLLRDNQEIDMLEFAGGEPFISPRLLKILDLLISSKRSNKISLVFHTNLTRLDDELLKKFDFFRGVKIIVSIDGYEKVNSYIRYPSDWSALEKNMKKLNDWAIYPFRSATCNITVQAYNLMDIPKLLEYLLGLEHFDEPILSMLSVPHHFSVHSLPIDYKNKASKQISDYLEQVKNRLPLLWNEQKKVNFISYLEAVIEHLGENRIGSLDLLRSTTEKLDHYRAQKIGESIPELKSLFS